MSWLPILTMNKRQTATKNEIISSCRVFNNEVDDTEQRQNVTKRNINIKSMFWRWACGVYYSHLLRTNGVRDDVGT